MPLARIAWYARGRVCRFVPGRPIKDLMASEPSAPANLKVGANGILIIQAEIDNSPWYGRLAPRKKGLSEGLVILFKSPDTVRA